MYSCLPRGRGRLRQRVGQQDKAVRITTALTSPSKTSRALASALDNPVTYVPRTHASSSLRSLPRMAEEEDDAQIAG
jgi:hypothetical protein